MRCSDAPDKIFEINDFTNATPLEELIFSAEQIFETWGLTQGGSWTGEQCTEFNRAESVTFGKQSYRLTHSLLPSDNNTAALKQTHFPSKTHCINRWFGLTEFLILSPETTDDAIYFLDSSKVLMSSMSIALTRTQCTIPLFVQLGSPSKRFYCGIWLHDCMQTNMDMVLLKTPPPQCSSLKEIVCFYKRSIPCAVSPFPQTNISVRYTFGLQSFIGCVSDSHVYKQVEGSLFHLPFGSIRDPVQDLLLATTWLGLSEHLIADSESGELDPLRAGSWSIRHTATSNPFCCLYNYLDYLFSLLGNQSNLVSVLGTSVDESIEVDVSAAFRSLTKPAPILQIAALDLTMLPGKLLGSYGALVDKELLGSFMNYIFNEPYSLGVSSETRSSSTKTCPRDSITCRIATSLCLVLCNHGGVKGFAQLWRCVVEQFRYHYEKGKLLPGCDSQPDPSFSLLHQKIQMINACIAQKIERESANYVSQEGLTHKSLHPTLTLLLTGEVLRVPISQKHPPMTEDMQEERMEALTRLGSSAEGSRLRAELHSFSLLSDMQAFKAANPDCRLEDFIRWYSPRDWITVPITRPISPETQLPDMVEAVEETTPQSGDEESVSDTLDIDVDSAGNVIEEVICKRKSSGESASEDSTSQAGEINLEDVNPQTENDDGLEGGVTGDLMDIGRSSLPVIEVDGESLQTAQENETMNLSNSEKLPSNADSDSDDEFMDAEESQYQSSEFKSVDESSVLSDRVISPDPPASQQECLSPDIEESEQTDTKSPDVSNSIKYEEPVDPAMYGGHLSARMSKESVWKEVWHVAKPVPIWHQKRLFDDTKEVEKILHYFTHSKICSIARLLIPSILHAGYSRMLECQDLTVPVIRDLAEVVAAKLRALHQYSNDDVDIYQEILKDIKSFEITASTYLSLKSKLSHDATSASHGETSAAPKKLSELERRTRRNMKGPRLTAPTAPVVGLDESALLTQLLASEIELPGAARSTWGCVLQRLFHAQQVASAPASNTPRHVPIFPLPLGREYILQTTTRHPSSVSRECAQRMFVTVSGSEFRMAFANSSDKKFL